jgi:hypothetical protein
MRWAEWTSGGRVPDDVFDDLMSVLAHGLPPRQVPGRDAPGHAAASGAAGDPSAARRA